MAVPVQVAYRDLEPSDALNALVQSEASKLERYFDGIISCRVVIEQAHRRHHSVAPFYARIVLSVPGEEIYVNQSAESSAPNDESRDPASAVRSAFRKARRSMQDYVQRNFRTYA
jgi:ribosome-associated translation inhibitor RaiA